jgi:tRNA A-37 threonylcarbamoyl transferase component Bud32
MMATQSAAPPSKKTAHPSVAELAAHFPDLEVLELIGAGGMGAVYKARQPKLDRLVALKVLSSDLAGDPAFAERFDREARLLARLHHANIVTVFDSGLAGPFAYLLMEFVDGVNLRQAMRAGRFTPPEALALVQDICAALKFAHEHGILHRDIKPENILIDSRGQVKIADFGIAKLTGEDGKDQLTLTQRGFVLGSPHYMAPEQLESPGDVDQRADIYSLGVVLYELLTGELPLGRFAPPSKKSAVDTRIDEIVMRTLERERELRFQTVDEVKTQVAAASEPGTRPAQDSSAESPVIRSGKTARFATAATICTVLSLIPAFLVGLLLIQSRKGNEALVIVFFWLPLVILAGLGIGFATRSLRQIRGSEGRTPGTKRAKFAAFMWPWLSIVLMSGAGFFTLLDENVLGMKWKLPVGLLLIASSVLGIVMNAQISRWLKEARSAKISGHVWRFVLAALIALTGLYHYGKQRSLAWEDYQKENSAGLNVKMTISAGTTLHFKVIRVDAEGKETPLELQSSLSAPDDQLLHTTLEVGLTERWKKSDRQKLSAILLGLHGDKYSRSVYLDDIWEISRVEEGTESTGDERFELATRHDWLGRKWETLYIETTHTKKQP